MALGLDFWIQLLVVLAALFYGARKGGMGLGLIGGIGLIVLIFGFGLKPGKPPVDVILTILAVVCPDRGKDAPSSSALRLLPRSVHLLVPDGPLRYGSRRLHDAPDYL